MFSASCPPAGIQMLCMLCRPPCVLLSSHIKEAKEQKRLSKIVTDLGGTLASSHEEAFTHLVAPQFHKSLSALVALAAGARLTCSQKNTYVAWRTTVHSSLLSISDGCTHKRWCVRS